MEDAEWAVFLRSPTRLKRRGAEAQRKIGEGLKKADGCVNWAGTIHSQEWLCYSADYDFAGGGEETAADTFLDNLAAVIGSGRSLERGFGVYAIVG